MEKMILQLDYFDFIWAMGVGWVILAIVLLLVLNTAFLKVGLNAVHGKNKQFGDVMVTVIVGLILSIIPCLGCILYWVVINSRHKTGFGNAILAWLIAFLVPILIIVVLFVFVFGVLSIPNWF